ncbi:bZIP transcription factor, putative [Talaromyces stipitatus ATCC 10500]|uniref:BZIP transcription factor, putative n=1 Tax=Talaromyces stipitatus (strain ATCC 10500 / CBS 375.48 / QM 6759 / NRRL 1006) TaxID=441959 RepID=B8MH00_TALSN|nr:bZIP transcription factor, putative [Talaromyces stipitatus ATCC 10500]EED16381.1 bZIP transcription factor, putative [Talaromyces stipitatus ATCC 10500]
MAEDHQPKQQPQQLHPPPITTSQANLSSVRLQHFNFLAPAGQLPPPQQATSGPPAQHFPAGGVGPERRHYSFDTDTESQRYPLGSVPAVEYDQTEGLGGLSVSSYDSIDDDRIDPAMRGYPYHHGDKHINYHAPDHDVPYMANSLYPGNSYSVEDSGYPRGGHPAPGAGGGGDRTPSDISSSISPPNGQIGNNKYSTIPPGERLARALSIEEQNRLAIEEDKRRRNTAASARFRVKKKQREQALERAVQEATEVKASLEARVTQLEMENRWLKNLLTEKNENLLSRLAALQPADIEKLEQQQQNQQDSSVSSTSSSTLTQVSSSKKSDSHTLSARKPIKPKPTVGVGTDDDH